MSHILLMLAGIGATHHQAPMATWESCRSDVGCRWYGMPRAAYRPTGHTHRCTTSPAVTVCITYPRFAPKAAHRVVPAQAAPIIRATVQRVDGVYRTEQWLITWYGPTGSPMSSGQMPFVGAAACGWDVRLGTRIIVAGVGSFVCLDREGYLPFHHADLFNVPIGTGYRYVTVLP